MTLSKNSICCDKGLPYKYCCIANDLRKKELIIRINQSQRFAVKVDMTNDNINMASSTELPLKFFCKDHDFHFFGVLSVGECQDLTESLRSGSLTKQDILNSYKNAMNEEASIKLLQFAIEEYEVFKKRETVILKVIKAHFGGDFELSIPALFMLLEGILREQGGLSNGDSFKSTIPIKVWEQSGLYFVEDDARNFNAFISKLYAGGKDEEAFNRNPILHGFNVTYFSEEHSLLLILALIEIRTFNFWKKHLDEFPKQLSENIKSGIGNRHVKVGDKFSFKAVTEYQAEVVAVY